MDALDSAGADEHAVFTIPGITHAVPVYLEVFEALADCVGRRAVLHFELGEALNDVGDLALGQVVEKRLNPCGAACALSWRFASAQRTADFP